MNWSGAIRMGFNSTLKSTQGMLIYLLGAVLGISLVGGLFLMTAPPINDFRQAFAEIQKNNQSKPTGAVGENTDNAMNAQSQSSAPLSPDAKKADPFANHPTIQKWFAKSWPLVIILGLFSMLFGSYLYSWKMNYLVQRASGQDFVLRDSFRDALSLWVEYFKAFLIGLGFFLVAFAVSGGLCVLCFGVMPKVLAGLLTFLIVIVSSILLIWVGILLAFWYPAIAYEKKGALAGLRSSFHATKSRVFPLIGFYLVLGFISICSNIATRIVGFVIGVAGGIFHLPLFLPVILASVIGFLVGIFIDFLRNSSDIHYYLGVREQGLDGI